MNHILQSLKQLSYDELLSLQPHIERIVRDKNPANITANQKYREQRRELEEREAAKEARNKTVVAKLKSILVPGMRLKMKGCKDGAGIREFIKWGGDYLICWQIRTYRQWQSSGPGGVGRYTTITTNTNQVTTHMADKVMKIWIDGKETSIKDLI